MIPLNHLPLQRDPIPEKVIVIDYHYLFLNFYMDGIINKYLCPFFSVLSLQESATTLHIKLFHPSYCYMILHCLLVHSIVEGHCVYFKLLSI